MKVYVAGMTHLTHYTKVGAAFRGLQVINEAEDADLILIAHDTITDGRGFRHLSYIVELVKAYCALEKPVVLMSQVPPGFCRKQGFDNLYHYPETLRIKDSYERACNPEYIIIGYSEGSTFRHSDFVVEYCKVFNCPLYFLNYEEAEFAKIAVNTILATQVDYANRMASACEKIGADWDKIKEAIQNDKRIGPHAYLVPGRWQDSLHLLRDAVTLKEIESNINPIDYKNWDEHAR